MCRKTRAYGSAEDVEALTRSHVKLLNSQAFESSTVINNTEFQVLKQSLPAVQQHKPAKDLQRADDDRPLELQSQQLQDETDQTTHEVSDIQLAGNICSWCLIFVYMVDRKNVSHLVS